MLLRKRYMPSPFCPYFKLAGCQHHRDVIVSISVPSRFGVGREAPIRHDRAIGFGEEFGGGLRVGPHQNVLFTLYSQARVALFPVGR